MYDICQSLYCGDRISIYITYILTYELVFIHAVDAVQVLSKAAINGNKIHRETSSEAKKSEVASISVLCDYAQV